MRITVNLHLKNSKTRKDRKCPVYARCTMEGNRIELSTGIFISDENWDPDSQMIRGRTENDSNP
jgi:hypothetical protein